jgi:hypothetical protein
MRFSPLANHAVQTEAMHTSGIKWGIWCRVVIHARHFYHRADRETAPDAGLPALGSSV